MSFSTLTTKCTFTFLFSIVVLKNPLLPELKKKTRQSYRIALKLTQSPRVAFQFTESINAGLRNARSTALICFPVDFLFGSRPNN